MLIHVLNQRNEAWHEENALRARQVELEQQLAVAEEYNDHLHEEVHLLHNQLHPLLPPDEDEMGSGVIMAEDDDDFEVNGPERGAAAADTRGSGGAALRRSARRGRR